MTDPSDLTGTSHQIRTATIRVTRHIHPEDIDDSEELELKLEAGTWPPSEHLLEHFGKGRRGSVQTLKRVGLVRLEDGQIDSIWKVREPAD